MIIVMRTDLNMRKGKMIAQGAHAAILAWLTITDQMEGAARRWVEQHGMRKICVGVDSEDALRKLLESAYAMGVHAAHVVDAGLTEFDGPTLTCAAFGPDTDERINAITGTLKLL